MELTQNEAGEEDESRDRSWLVEGRTSEDCRASRGIAAARINDSTSSALPTLSFPGGRRSNFRHSLVFLNPTGHETWTPLLKFPATADPALYTATLAAVDGFHDVKRL